MKNNFDEALVQAAIKTSSKQGLISESLNFEGVLIESSKHSGSLSREWVEAEVAKSGNYFTAEIYKKR
ncbi:hypothetical protein [Pseudomonas putida]|uniref:Uncharacterized protein n=1 Tax=Pseudomonas putida TaxID=303 RepID=A0A2C5W5Y2_PSEPU|nr:hypothetical protein [Pseudomonas putida]PHH39530.1 hypothetical protein CRX57_04860 [Pseudomonas putida]